MAISEAGAQPNGADGQIQDVCAWRMSGMRRRAVLRRTLRVLALAPALAMTLGGCSNLSSINPVNWWHDLQGGKIAEQRPAPPGAADAYPNLSTAPSKPAPPDRDAMKKLTDSLVADRSNARYTAEAAPIPDPSSPTASPALFGGGAPRPAPVTGPGGATPATASLSAASAPSSPPPSSPPPPVRAVTGAPLAGPSPAPSFTAPAAEPPALPTREPPRPDAAGARPPPVPTPIPAAPMPASARGPRIVVQFPTGGSALSPTGEDAVKQFAASRGNAAISVVGYGDAGTPDPAAQTSALGLGMARARAIASALTANGVPSSAIRIGAEAAGRGAVLRLLQ